MISLNGMPALFAIQTSLWQTCSRIRLDNEFQWVFFIMKHRCSFHHMQHAICNKKAFLLLGNPLSAKNCSISLQNYQIIELFSEVASNSKSGWSYNHDSIPMSKISRHFLSTDCYIQSSCYSQDITCKVMSQAKVLPTAERSLVCLTDDHKVRSNQLSSTYIQSLSETYTVLHLLT